MEQFDLEMSKEKEVKIAEKANEKTVRFDRSARLMDSIPLFTLFLTVSLLKKYGLKHLGKSLIFSGFALGFLVRVKTPQRSFRMAEQYDENLKMMGIDKFEPRVVSVLHQLHASNLIIEKYDWDKKLRQNKLGATSATNRQ